MKIGTRMPPFSHQIGFDAYAAWLAENGFGAVDTPPLTRQICPYLRATRLGYRLLRTAAAKSSPATQPSAARA